jgi:putative transposase
MRQPSGEYRKTCKRCDAEGDAHFLTFSCFRNRPFLNAERPRRWFLEAVEAARRKQPFELWGYVIMPEHIHMMILPHPDVRISAILSALKLPVARRAVAWVRKHLPQFLARMTDVQPGGKSTHRFWQRGGGYDRNIRSAREAHEELDYMHLNPIRRKLVTQLEDWPWSSWRAWEEGIDEPIAIDRESFPVLIH